MPSEDQNLSDILRQRLIPEWERFGLERLAVTAPTLAEFTAQPLPKLVRTAVKKRIGKRVNKGSKRLYGNTSRSVGSWPEDRQEALRFPCLIYTLKGQADLHVADYMVYCPEGHFLLQAPGVAHPDGTRPHLEGERAERYCELLWFLAPPGTNSVASFVCFSQGERHWSRQEFDFCVVSNPAVVLFFNFFMREMLEKPRYYQKTVTNAFSNFLLLFERELRLGNFYQSGESRENVTFSEYHSPIDQARQYIKSHLNQPLTTEDVANAVFMSRNNFMEHFTRETGQTFHRYLVTQRMEEAKRLLLEGNWSLELICQFVGLHPTQFRYQFKKYFGASPSAFRRQLK
jgi:AraC-like DNA-binding protein